MYVSSVSYLVEQNLNEEKEQTKCFWYIILPQYCCNVDMMVTLSYSLLYIVISLL